MLRRRLNGPGVARAAPAWQGVRARGHSAWHPARFAVGCGGTGAVNARDQPCYPEGTCTRSGNMQSHD